MTQVAVDVLIVISYNFEDVSKSCIYTNAREEALEELLSNWVQDQMFRNEPPEPRKFDERDVYTIKIGLVIEDDSFCTESDTGNKGLTVGIVMAVLGMLPRIPKIDFISIKTLRERPACVIDAVMNA